MLKARILTALVLLALLLVCLFYLPPHYWAMLTLLAILVGAWEWSNLAAYSLPAKWIYLLVTAALTWGLFGPDTFDWSSGPLLIVAALFWLLVVPLWLKQRWVLRNRLLLAVVGWIVLIPTWLALVQLRGMGPQFLLGIMAVVWVADSAAFFAGRRFGRHKLAPAISPGKTWEGVAGALAGVVLYAVLCWLAVPDLVAKLPVSGATLVIFGLVGLGLMTYISILGDLFESWMKRQAGMKDSGRILPGHGGILDRIDALTSTLPVVACTIFLWKLYGAG
jgi:phosphatidate cytidylyltransferase